MERFKNALFVAFACLMISSGTRAQPSYRWNIIFSPKEDSVSVDSIIGWNYWAVDSWNEVITIGVVRKNEASHTNDRNVLLFLHSTDGGETWVEQDPGLPHYKDDFANTFLKIEQIDSLNVVALTDSGDLVRTTDGGNSWIKQNLHASFSVGLDVDFSDSLHGIVLVGNIDTNILITSDGGTNWDIAPFQIFSVPPEELGASMCHSFGNGAFIVSGLGGLTIYRTTDNWQTYDTLPAIVPWTDDSDLVESGKWRFYGSDTIVAYGVRAGGHAITPSFVTVSTDGGESWEPIYLPNSQVDPVGTMSRLDRNIVFAAGNSGFPYLLFSTDHGITWAVDTFALDTVWPQVVEGITVTPNGNAVALFPSSVALGVPVSDGVPALAAQTIQTSYPNPFSTNCTITYQNAVPGAGTVVVTDILGRTVESFPLGTLAPGEHTVTLDGSALPAGAYRVTISVGSETSSETVIRVP